MCRGLRVREVMEGELREVRKPNSGKVIREVAPAVASDGEVRESQGRRRQRVELMGPAPVQVLEMELLDAVEGRRPEPRVEGGVAVVAAGVGDAGEVHERQPASWARVGGQDGRNARGDAVPVAPACGTKTELAVVQVERSGAPEGFPAGGNGLGTDAGVGWEQGNDGAEDRVGEGTDVSDAGLQRRQLRYCDMGRLVEAAAALGCRRRHGGGYSLLSIKSLNLWVQISNCYATVSDCKYWAGSGESQIRVAKWS